jgi:hypothetical protein
MVLALVMARFAALYFLEQAPLFAARERAFQTGHRGPPESDQVQRFVFEQAKTRKMNRSDI